MHFICADVILDSPLKHYRVVKRYKKIHLFASRRLLFAILSAFRVNGDVTKRSLDAFCSVRSPSRGFVNCAE